ncbi:MAG: FtsX-like permease family protein, partial [bacterium]
SNKYPYFLETCMDRHHIIFTWIRTQTLPIVIIFSLITLVGITNVMATVSLLVNESSKEIGILLAQGFQKYQIRNVFLIESGFIGLVGSTIGVFLAIFFTFIQSKYNFIQLPEEVYFMNTLPISFDYNLCFVIMMLSLFITMFSCFLPVKTIFDNSLPKLLEN